MERNETRIQGKMDQNAKLVRLVSRVDIFQRKRKTYDQLDFLVYYQPQTKNNILHSMQGPLPEPLPPLALETISFYRRNNRPIFSTRKAGSMELEGHMTYQSLWILASLDDRDYNDYSSIIKEFERDLPLYLSAKSKDIYEMAVIAAGNKILGREADILGIVERDALQLWVLVNHIYENKISYTKLFPFLFIPQNEFPFKSLYQLTMIIDEVSQKIMDRPEVVECILRSLNAENENIRKYAMRIIGNIVAIKQEFINAFHQFRILDYLLVNLNCSNGDVRRDACWLISNLCTKKVSANAVINDLKLIPKLVDLFAFESVQAIKKEICYILCYIGHYADRNKALMLLGHENVLEICYKYLCEEDIELNEVTLLLLKQMLELGDSFKYHQGQNVVLRAMSQAQPLCSEISNKSYSENSEVSSISLEILSYLEEDDD